MVLGLGAGQGQKRSRCQGPRLRLRTELGAGVEPWLGSKAGVRGSGRARAESGDMARPRPGVEPRLEAGPGARGTAEGGAGAEL